VCNVLIVDDYADTTEAIAELIGNKGHSCHVAANGREAMTWLEEQADLPCLILLDLRMPVMDGWDFLLALRSRPRWANIGVIVISATIDDDAPTPVLRAKAFWSKPPDAELLANVHRYCDQHRDAWNPSTRDS
jgi:CheY-like chemotaxis protein